MNMSMMEAKEMFSEPHLLSLRILNTAGRAREAGKTNKSLVTLDESLIHWLSTPSIYCIGRAREAGKTNKSLVTLDESLIHWLSTPSIYCIGLQVFLIHLLVESTIRFLVVFVIVLISSGLPVPTIVVVSPVGSITYLGERVTYGNSGVRVMSHQLYSGLTRLQMGLVDDKMGWTVKLKKLILFPF
nr:branched-chain-amino-acid aminotransferase 3, chloroplastic [Tanacetum cinerariifolium]